MNTSALLLEVENLETQFITNDGVVQAVDKISFGVDRGESLGIVGESGCGKSVTALSVMRLVPAPGVIANGSIRFEGRDLMAASDADMRSIRGNRIAMIFQDPMTSLNPAMTIGRQICEALELHRGMRLSEAKTRAIDLLDRVGIPDAKQRFDDYPHEFSGGMRQRAMIAIALSCSPSLILADEPTTALDVTIQAQILDLLKDLSQETETAFVFITHDLGVVAGMTQKVHVMYAGRIVEKADTPELFANPRMPYTWGLLGSIPRLDADPKSELNSIPGMPPDLARPLEGCRFAARCAYAQSVCLVSEPELLPIPNASRDHQARCWATQEGGWLVQEQ